MHASTSASELDIEISSVEHVQFIVGFFSDIRQPKIAFEGVRKILPKGGHTPGSIYIIVHDFTSTSEHDTEISSVAQHVQFIARF